MEGHAITLSHDTKTSLEDIQARNDVALLYLQSCRRYELRVHLMILSHSLCRLMINLQIRMLASISDSISVNLVQIITFSIDIHIALVDLHLTVYLALKPSSTSNASFRIS